MIVQRLLYFYHQRLIFKELFTANLHQPSCHLPVHVHVDVLDVNTIDRVNVHEKVYLLKKHAIIRNA